MSRSRTRPYAVALAAAALLLTGCSSGSVDDQRPEEQRALPQPLPELSLDAFGSDAEPLQLADVRGPAVINLWASWCTPCRKELPIFEELHRSGAVDVIGIDFQDPNADDAVRLVERTGVTYPLYEDVDGEIEGLAPFPAMRALPFLAFVDDQGRVVHQEFAVIDDLAEVEALVQEHLGVEA